MRKSENALAGGGFILVASAAYACMGALVKFGGKIPDQQLVFFRNFICLLLIVPWLLLPKPKPLKTSVFPTHLLRSVAGLLNMYCFFYSIRYIILTDAMLLNNTMPLFVPLVVWIWKGEKLPPKLIPGLIIGFVGVLLILRPGISLFQPAALVALASGIFMSISMAGNRELGKIEPLFRILFYYFAISSIVSAFPLLWGWENHTAFLWLILLGVGITGAIYQYFLTLGYEYASASKISPFIYFAVILSGLFDWLFWHKPPHITSYIGTILVIIGAVWSVRVTR
jgi:drug/metabolite transporter (DMT)-like permease